MRARRYIASATAAMVATFMAACLPGGGDGEGSGSEDQLVECVADENCRDAQLCLRPPTRSGVCVETCDQAPENACDQPDDCVLRYEQNGVALVCLPDTIPCQTSEDCPRGVFCAESGVCDPSIECQDDIDCPLVNMDGEALFCRDQICQTAEDQNGADAGISDAG